MNSLFSSKLLLLKTYFPKFKGSKTFKNFERRKPFMYRSRRKRPKLADGSDDESHGTAGP